MHKTDKDTDSGDHQQTLVLAGRRAREGAREGPVLKQEDTENQTEMLPIHIVPFMFTLLQPIDAITDAVELPSLGHSNFSSPQRCVKVKYHNRIALAPISLSHDMQVYKYPYTYTHIYIYIYIYIYT